MTGLAPDTFLRRWLVRLAGDGAEIWQHTVAPWRSITFSGERHSVCMKLASARQVDRLTSHDLEVIPVFGALVVDATVTGLQAGPDHSWLYLELLTLARSDSHADTTAGIRPSVDSKAQAVVA